MQGSNFILLSSAKKLSKLLGGYLLLSAMSISLQGQEINKKDCASLKNSQYFTREEWLRKKEGLVNKGFLLASVDSITIGKDSAISYRLIANKRYDSLVLEITSSSNNVKDTYFIKGNSFIALSKKLDELLNYQIQQGYLKANYVYDTTHIKDHKLTLRYELNLYKKYRIDSIRLHSSSPSINLDFIRQYIARYYKGKSQFDWKEIAIQLRYFDFVEMDKNSDLTLLDSTAILNLYLKERKLNQVNAILGILSNAYNSGQVELTGDVKLELVNLFKRGVSFQLNWQKNLDNSQFLYSKINVPFILNTKLGVGGYFNLEKFDTSFLRQQYQLSLNYYIQSNHILSFHFRKNKTNITGYNQLSVLNGNLPRYLDYSTNELGLGYSIYKLNRPFFTKRGWSLESYMLIGNKTTFINSRIAELKDMSGESLARLYDSIPASQLTFSFMADLTKYTPLSEHLILKSHLLSRSWFSETISTSEMHFFGGYKLPRGFDDNNLLSPWFVILSQDIQYYLSEYFYSNIFVDLTYMKNYINKTTSLPVGIGAGLSLKTGDNIFQLNMGSGYLGDSRFSLGNMKVHFNYISVF